MSEHDAAAELAARMRGGDAEAFDGWVRATHELVYRVCLRLLGQAQEAEDAVQETYIRAWRSADSLQQPQAHRGWVCRIARRACVDLQRKRDGRRPRDEAPSPTARPEQLAKALEHLASPDPLPDAILQSAEARALLRSAIDTLKEKHRVVLLLREVDELSYDEISEALALPRGTVESRLHRARAQLARAVTRQRRASRSDNGL